MYVSRFGLYRFSEAVRPSLISSASWSSFTRVQPSKSGNLPRDAANFNVGEDCPIFEELFSFCEQYAGASLAAARKLTSETTDIAINWSGGLHHAKKGEASGFCYVNDIVLGILEMLRWVR